MSRQSLELTLALGLVLMSLTSVLLAQFSYGDLTVSRYWKFEVLDDVNSFQLLMLNTTSNTISAASSTYVSFTVEDGRLKIADIATDSVLPVLGLPTYDHIYVLKAAEGDFYIKVLNYNSTDGTFTELAGVHISPYADEVMVAPLTSKGIVIIYLGTMKFEFNVTGWNLIAIVPTSEETTVYVDDIVEAEVPPESLSAPFSGTEVTGSDSRVIEITGSGTLRIWFREAHQGSDMDLAWFYGTNSHYDEVDSYVPVDTYQKWQWIIVHMDGNLHADIGPEERTFDLSSAGGRIKLVVYPYQGNTANLGSWELVYQGATMPTTTTAPIVTQSRTTTVTTSQIAIDNNAMKWLAIGVGIIALMGFTVIMSRRG